MKARLRIIPLATTTTGATTLDQPRRGQLHVARSKNH